MSNGKWIKYNDTLVCPKCGFGYFPNYYYFKNHECILNPFSEQYIFKICPDCGANMEVDMREVKDGKKENDN